MSVSSISSISSFSRKVLRYALVGSLTASVLSGVLAGQASAAPRCDAPDGWYCIAVVNDTKEVRSWRNPRWNNQCMPNSAPGSKIHYQSYTDRPSLALVPYLDANCGKAAPNNYSRSYDKDEGRFVVARYHAR